MNPGVLNSAKTYQGILIARSSKTPTIQGSWRNIFLIFFVIKAQIKIGGRVSIAIIGPLASSPIPIPTKKIYPQ